MRFNVMLTIRRGHVSRAMAEAQLEREGFSRTLTAGRWRRNERGGHTIAQIEYENEQWVTRKYWRDR